jgi:phosphoglycolate phosphatase-like HAD superfamily hydrolase
VTRPTVLLFDIDGTLVTTAGAGRRAIERTFLLRYGRDDGLRDVHFGGMTDRAIARAGLVGLGEPAEGPEAERAIDGILAQYIEVLTDELAREPRFRLHAGVLELLDALAPRPATAIGLGTGNVRAGARVKLTRVGILERFAFGGFGCDHEQRAELLRIGSARGASLLGCAAGDCRVVVVGDTPHDVAAARAIGAASIGVGTGGCERDRMHAAGATWAFDDLGAPGVLDVIREGDCT